jgi:hypothetical protein
MIGLDITALTSTVHSKRCSVLGQVGCSTRIQCATRSAHSLRKYLTKRSRCPPCPPHKTEHRLALRSEQIAKFPMRRPSEMPYRRPAF